jgi:D-xylonolactonase
MAHFTIDAFFARFANPDGMPDGAPVDKDGQAWSAFWDGGYIARLPSDGSAVPRISLPTRQVSSLTFGGDDYGDNDDYGNIDDLGDIYVTTAGGHRKNHSGVWAGGWIRISQRSSRGAGIVLAPWDFIDLRTG